jgi:hypothetical protein
MEELEKLMCSVPGCPNRWSVHISGQRPKCSSHQWSDKNPATKRDIAVASLKQPPVKHWQDDEIF